MKYNRFSHKYLAFQEITKFLHKFKLGIAFVNDNTSDLQPFVNSYRHCNFDSPCQQKTINMQSALTMEQGKIKVFTTPCCHGVAQAQQQALQNRFLKFDFADKLLKLDIKNPNEIHRKGATRLQLLKLMAEWKPEFNRKGLYLHGQSGVGKTYIFIAFANHLAQKYPKSSFIFLSCSNLIQQLKAEFSNSHPNDNLLTSLKSCDILFLDDFGGTNWSTWLRDDIFFDLLNHRFINRKITFINSNFNHQELTIMLSKISDPTASIKSSKVQRFMNRIEGLTTAYKLEK